MKQYAQEGQFALGSMLPKVEAAIKFAESKRSKNIDYVIRKSQRRIIWKNRDFN